MDAANLPWDKGIAFVFAVFLLKMLYDAVYVKIPDGFQHVSSELQVQMERADDRHAEHLAGQKELKKQLKKVRKSLEVRRTRARARAKKSAP
jgi:F0F1-type ATP synthase membrane subunit b/b'